MSEQDLVYLIVLALAGGRIGEPTVIIAVVREIIGSEVRVDIIVVLDVPHEGVGSRLALCHDPITRSCGQCDCKLRHRVNAAGTPLVGNRYVLAGERRAGNTAIVSVDRDGPVAAVIRAG